MISNYFKVAFRYLLRHKGYSFINILGLAIGIACCLLIALFVRSEWSYDRFHSKAGRLYRVWLQENYDGQVFTNTVTPIPLGPALQSKMSDIESSSRVFSFNALVQYKNTKFNEPVSMVDTGFFNLFDFKLQQGDRNEAFPNSQSVVLTRALAKKYFGADDAIGKTLEIQLGEEKVLFTVSAIAANVPEESSIAFSMLIPHANEKYIFSERAITSGWQQVFGETYVLLRKGAGKETTEAKLPGFVKQIAGDRFKEGQYNLHLQPITDIHLNKKLPAGNSAVSDPAYSYILGTIGVLILLIACINFVTLSVGRSATRAMEVGVRKVLGAERKQLVRQFWGEAMLMVALALLIAVGTAALFLKPFNDVAAKQLSLSLNPFVIFFLLLVIAVVGFIAGIYPAIVLSAFRPVKVLKGELQSGSSIGFFRKSLIAGQFIASITMIIGTIVTGQQLRYLRTKNLGYDREHLVIIPTNKSRQEGMPLAERFKSELEKDPQVAGTAISLFSFAEPGWVNLGYEDDKKVYRNFRMNAVDDDFVPTMKLQVVAGRNFSKHNPGDIANGMLVNEALVKEYGWIDPIGKKLPGRYPQQVIGVIKDFHFESLHTGIQPLALVVKPDTMFRLSNDVNFGFAAQPRVNIRLKAGDLTAQMASLKKAWASVAGDQEFEYRFLDESLNNMYREEQRLGSIVRYASVLSIFIACMGLFGLATLIAARRTKEIGIRKVLGANTASLVGLLSKDFVILVALASLVAFPMAWWALHHWLQDFAYRIPIHWWVFLIAAGLALLVAVATVSVQAIRVAMANPVRSLRTE
jgi:putative ABC transport system permease protein